MKSPIVAIFGSGTAVPGSKAYQLAYQLGFLLAKNHMTIANGGYKGIMEASAEGASQANGKVIAITAAEFHNSKNRFSHFEVKTKRYQDRLFYLIHAADAFIVLNGGTGTMVEMTAVIEMMNKGFLSKPTVILGADMQRLARFIKKMPESRLPKEIVFKKTPEDAVRYLKTVIARSEATKQSSERRLPRRPLASSQ